ncbi:hypothetical protein OE88DRAFT_1739601 [Heliocybe sulcata]|uniref:Uncharacterized protein n=1 Tax=Heliocybe sulcata TaxID=5364 RepID=A0A5C3MLY2_9AGAM|nr:hypothetical protein OE88DRAFT_1739601 [Heliocybe sulcata]
MSYVEALATLMPEASMAFDHSGLHTHLKSLIGRLSSLGYLSASEARLLASSRRALVSTADADMLAMIKGYDAIEETFEDKMNTVLLAERFLPQLATFLSEAFTSDNNPSSHLPFLPIIKSLTVRPPPFWLNYTLSSSIRFLAPDDIRRRLWMTITEQDLMRRALMVRLVNSLISSIGSAGSGVSAEPWVWETIWLPLWEVDVALNYWMPGGKREKKPAGKFRGNPFDFPCTAMKAPASLSKSLEQHLMYLSANRESIPTMSSVSHIFDTVNSEPYRILSRFIYEWGISAVMGRQVFSLGFQAKVREKVLVELTARIIELLGSCEGIPTEIDHICKKDRDAYDAIVSQLRQKLRIHPGNDVTNLQKVLRGLSSSSFDSGTVNLRLESKIQDRSHGYPTDETQTNIATRLYCTPGGKDIGFYFRMRERHQDINYSQCKRLMGDSRSLRWVLASEIQRRPLPYHPIVAGIDELGSKLYVGCLTSARGHCRPHPYCLLLGGDFKADREDDLREWRRSHTYGGEPEVYILAVRVMAASKGTAHVYWASPSWNHRLCSCMDPGCRDGDPSYSVTHSRTLHIPEAIPDVSVINAVTGQELAISSGETKQVEVVSWLSICV